MPLSNEQFCHHGTGANFAITSDWSLNLLVMIARLIVSLRHWHARRFFIRLGVHVPFFNFFLNINQMGLHGWKKIEINKKENRACLSPAGQTRPGPAVEEVGQADARAHCLACERAFWLFITIGSFEKGGKSWNCCYFFLLIQSKGIFNCFAPNDDGLETSLETKCCCFGSKEVKEDN